MERLRHLQKQKNRPCAEAADRAPSGHTCLQERKCSEREFLGWQGCWLSHKAAVSTRRGPVPELKGHKHSLSAGRHKRKSCSHKTHVHAHAHTRSHRMRKRKLLSLQTRSPSRAPALCSFVSLQERRLKIQAWSWSCRARLPICSIFLNIENSQNNLHVYLWIFTQTPCMYGCPIERHKRGRGSELRVGWQISLMVTLKFMFPLTFT